MKGIAMYSWQRELTATEKSFNEVVYAIAKHNGTSGDMAYGSVYARQRNERKARQLFEAVGCDYAVALTVANIGL